MARQPRIVYPGAYYHVMARGNQRQLIVKDDDDRRMFQKTTAEVVEKTGWEMLAWVLMNNHYHWVIRTPEPNLVEGMKWFQNTYTRRFAVRHKAWGHLFGGRYKAIVVDPEDGSSRKGEYLPALMDYVHLNPVRAGLVRPGEGLSLLAYPWSSLALGYGKPLKQRPSWLSIPSGLALAGLNDRAGDRREYLRRLEERARLEDKETCGLAAPDGQSLRSTLRRGWYWGRQEFGEKLAKALKKTKNRTYRSSKLVREGQAREAGKLLADGLRHFKLSANEPWDRSSYRSRAAIAWALARKTSASQGWIAEQLGLRNAANVSQLTRRFELTMKERTTSSFKTWTENVKNC